MVVELTIRMGKENEKIFFSLLFLLLLYYCVQYKKKERIICSPLLRVTNSHLYLMGDHCLTWGLPNPGPSLRSRMKMLVNRRSSPSLPLCVSKDFIGPRTVKVDFLSSQSTVRWSEIVGLFLSTFVCFAWCTSYGLRVQIVCLLPFYFLSY